MPEVEALDVVSSNALMQHLPPRRPRRSLSIPGRPGPFLLPGPTPGDPLTPFPRSTVSNRQPNDGHAFAVVKPPTSGPGVRLGDRTRSGLLRAPNPSVEGPSATHAGRAELRVRASRPLRLAFVRHNEMVHSSGGCHGLFTLFMLTSPPSAENPLICSPSRLLLILSLSPSRVRSFPSRLILPSSACGPSVLTAFHSLVLLRRHPVWHLTNTTSYTRYHAFITEDRRPGHRPLRFRDGSPVKNSKTVIQGGAGTKSVISGSRWTETAAQVTTEVQNGPSPGTSGLP